MFINYVDRGNLATAAPLIATQLGLSASRIGVLQSAFFWSYVPAQLLAGWLAERVNPYRTLAVGLALWSLATAAMGLVSGFATLIVLRVLLGLGESAAFPSISALLARHRPDRLGEANGLISVGLALGPAFGTFVGGLLMARFGWRSVFVLFGAISLAWLIPWQFATRATVRAQDASSIDNSPPFAAMLRRRDLWGACLGHFCANFCLYFVIVWLPYYLVQERGFSVTAMAKIGGVVYLAYAASAFVTGKLSDRWIRMGMSPSRVRKSFLVASLLIVAACMIVAAVGSATISVASLLFAGAAFGLGTPNLYAIGQTLAGPNAAGKWMGIQNCVGNSAGIVAPVITGVLFDRTGQFYWAFIAAAVVGAVGACGWGLVIRKVAPLDWGVGAAGDSVPTTA